MSFSELMRESLIMKQSKITFPKGILKIKKGYNPNSSSIGTILYSFPLAFIAMNIIIAFLAAFIKKGAKKEEK
jgi:hypothetical protein